MALHVAQVWLPVALGSLRAGAWLDVSLRGRCRACAPLAHTLALLAVLVLNYVNWTVLFAVPNPNMWQYTANASAWPHPENADGFANDPIGRQTVKWQLFLLTMCALACVSRHGGR